jgi:SagB-type dehydrogenase family enzyme
MNRLRFATIVGFVLLASAMISVSENISSSKADASQTINLPAPRTNGSFAVEKALQERRSIRSFSKDGLTLDEVSQLLWAAQGVTDDRGHRTAPSAMAKYPLQVYLLAGNVTGLATGVYHYLPQSHSLNVLEQGKIDDSYNAAAGSEAWIKTASAVFVITGDINSMNSIPGRDSGRWVYVEAGAAAENLLLEVVSLNLSCTYTAGFDANRTEQLLGLHAGEVPIGVLPVGRKA